MKIEFYLSIFVMQHPHMIPNKSINNILSYVKPQYLPITIDIITVRKDKKIYLIFGFFLTLELYSFPFLFSSNFLFILFSSGSLQVIRQSIQKVPEIKACSIWDV